MKKYQYLASWDDQTLTRVGEPVVVLGDSNISQVEVILPSNFLLDPTKAVARIYFLLPGEKESDFETLETPTKDENGDSRVTWMIKHAHTQKGGRLAFSLTLIGDNTQWDSRTVIIPVYESRYQPESEEAEEPYTGRLTALEGSMASIRGEFAEVQEDFEDLKETATLGTPIPESLVANMTAGHVYIYTGTESGYTAGHVYYYVDGALKDGGVYGGTAVDATLTQSGKAADAKKTGDEISAIKEDLSHKADYDFSYTTDSGTGKYLMISNAWKVDSRFYYICTDIIPCAAGDIFEYIGGSYVAASVLFYKSGVFVSGVNYTTNTEVTIPENVDGVRFQSAKLSEVTLSVKKIFPHPISDIILGTDAKENQLWMMTPDGTRWADFLIDNPFANKMDYASIFEDETKYSLTTGSGWYCSSTSIPAHAYIKKVKFKSSASGSGQIILATNEFIPNRYMMNVKVWDVDYVAGWNEVEIGISTGEHTDYLLGHKGLNIVYGDYTTLSGTVDAKYMFGGGTFYKSNAVTGPDAENVRFAFGTTGSNYKNCHAFDAEIYTGVYPIDHDAINGDVTLFDGSLLPKYKTIDGTIGYVGRWYDYTDGSDTYKVASADGAYACFKVSGATSVAVTWGGNFNENSCVRYRIDNGECIRETVVAKGNIITLPDTSEHIIQLIMDGINSGNHYTSGNGIGIKAITTSGNLKAIAPTNKKIVFFGDSLTRGVRALGAESEEVPNTNSAYLSYAWYAAYYLNATPILAGYGSSGVIANGEFSKCINAINYVVNGVESDDLEADLIVINHGHNDVGTASETFIAEYGAVLDRFMTKYPGVPVICLTPFNHRFEAEIRTCAESRPWCHYINATPWYLERFYADGPGHLLAEGAQYCGEKLAKAIKALKLGI